MGEGEAAIEYRPQQIERRPEAGDRDGRGLVEAARPRAVAWRDRAQTTRAGHAEQLVPIVPPRGALPCRFGAGPLGVSLLRLSAVAAVLTLLASLASFVVGEGRVPGALQDLAKGVVLPLSAYLVALLFRRGKAAPLAIVFEPAGVSVIRVLGSDRFAWGELVGLAPPDPGSTAWALVARRGTREWRTRLDAARGWTRELLAELAGETGEAGSSPRGTDA